MGLLSALSGCVVGGFRVPVILFAELIAFVVCVVATAGASLNQPLRGWRRRLLEVVMPRATRALLWGIGFWRIKEFGTACSQIKLVVSNHVSVFDGFIYTAILPGAPPSFVAKAEGMADMPLFGRYFQAMQMVYVNRKDKVSRSASMKQIVDRVSLPQSAAWPPLVIFPEGTTNTEEPSKLLPFNMGAFRPGLPVQPIFIHYPGMELKPVPGWTGFWEDIGLFARALVTLRNTCHVHYLPVYSPSDDEQKDPAVFAANVAALIEKRARKIIKD